MRDVVVLVIGVLCAAAGGELFVRGAVGLAAWARVPAGVIGTTVAAFATSSPELSVAIQAAASDRPAIALGDALGSNVVNIGLVLGVTVAMGTLAVDRREVRRDLTVAAAAPALTVVALIDGKMVRAEAATLIAVFVAWLVIVTKRALRGRSRVLEVVESNGRRQAVLAAVGGLVLLIAAGNFIVSAAKGIGDALGLEPFVVGATMVAAGTSAPELATAVVSRVRGHADVGVGTVLGSNVFNNLWIVGVAGLLHPIEVPVDEVLVAVVCCLAGLALVIPTRAGVLRRSRGVALLSLAVVYASVTVALGT
jgi:cation:H+ antiporter